MNETIISVDPTNDCELETFPAAIDVDKEDLVIVGVWRTQFELARAIEFNYFTEMQIDPPEQYDKPNYRDMFINTARLRVDLSNISDRAYQDVNGEWKEDPDDTICYAVHIHHPLCQLLVRNYAFDYFIFPHIQSSPPMIFVRQQYLEAAAIYLWELISPPTAEISQ